MEEQVREFHGIRYRLLAKDDIKKYVLGVARAEWEAKDFDVYGDDLTESVWGLQELDVEKIKPDRELLRSPAFQEDLRGRTDTMRSMVRKRELIPPLILRGSDFHIFDGYARYSVFLEMRISRCLAYVGELSSKK